MSKESKLINMFYDDTVSEKDFVLEVGDGSSLNTDDKIRFAEIIDSIKEEKPESYTIFLDLILNTNKIDKCLDYKRLVKVSIKELKLVYVYKVLKTMNVY